jgi:putative FmdB family regulatory protein
MPLFDFSCNSCHYSFEELLRSADLISGVSCPNCGGSEIQKKPARIASRLGVTSGFSLGASAAASCNTGST